jgi:hypothetical protein
LAPTEGIVPSVSALKIRSYQSTFSASALGSLRRIRPRRFFPRLLLFAETGRKTPDSKRQSPAATRPTSPTQWRKNYEEVIADTIRKRQQKDFWATAVASVIAGMSVVFLFLQLR